MNNKDGKQVIENSFGTWYKVCFVPRKYCGITFNEVRRNEDNYIYSTLRLDNINGWGIGTVFFTNEQYQIVVLDWKNIISMIPLNEQPVEIENTNN